ncbi:hypothetical protein Q3G72_020671 [Acer saccharum]|nr:hypothetical protein Q3G72_020671 [Acer saccharum]
METMPNLYVEHASDDNEKLIEANDIGPHTRSRTYATESSVTLIESSVTLIESIVTPTKSSGTHVRKYLTHWNYRFKEVLNVVEQLQEEVQTSDKTRQQQHNELVCMIRRHHGSSTSMHTDDLFEMTRDDPPAFWQTEDSYSQQDHDMPLVDPHNLTSISHVSSDSQRDPHDHSMDPQDPISLSYKGSNIRRDLHDNPVDPYDLTSLSIINTITHRQ